MCGGVGSVPVFASGRLARMYHPAVTPTGECHTRREEIAELGSRAASAAIAKRMKVFTQLHRNVACA